jgi:hypothetical protein
MKVLIRQIVLHFWMMVPFGYLCSFRFGSLQVSVTKTLLVVISDGEINDALPIDMVSVELTKAIAKRMRRMGYALAKVQH